jgi:hypothetical protein
MNHYIYLKNSTIFHHVHCNHLLIFLHSSHIYDRFRQLVCISICNSPKHYITVATRVFITAFGEVTHGIFIIDVFLPDLFLPLTTHAFVPTFSIFFFSSPTLLVENPVHTVELREMTKITNSNQSHKSQRKYKSEYGRTRTSEYIRGGIRCHGGVSITCRPVTPAVCPLSNVKISSQNQCVQIR